MAEDILDILTRAERPKFKIDGKRYEMLHPNELSMLDFRELGKRGAAMVAAANSFEETDNDTVFDQMIDDMNAILDTVAPGLPKKVRDKLNPFHVQKIVQAFMRLVRAGGAPDGRRNRKKSSRGSAASTRGRRPTTG